MLRNSCSAYLPSSNTLNYTASPSFESMMDIGNTIRITKVSRVIRADCTYTSLCRYSKMQKYSRLACFALAAAFVSAASAQNSITLIGTSPNGAVYNVDGQNYAQPTSALWPEGS